MTCIIVDDEAAAIEILEGYTQKKTTLKHLASFTNPIEALSYVQNHSVDLIFLDINMPHLSGLGFLELLKGRSKVILTTAYSEYALDGYKYDVVDYLTKPISFENFLRAVQKAEDRNTPSSSASKSTDKNALDDFIMVKSDHKGKLVKVVFSDILYIESMKSYFYKTKRPDSYPSFYEGAGREITQGTFFSDTQNVHCGSQPDKNDRWWRNHSSRCQRPCSPWHHVPRGVFYDA
jgi:DNA-binding LytR/AlgR family response regulator